MMTLQALKPGDYVRTRYKGNWEYAILKEPLGTMTYRELIEESSIPKGAKVTQCVWKGEQLQPRGSYTHSALDLLSIRHLFSAPGMRCSASMQSSPQM
jgi:hypothetical protein